MVSQVLEKPNSTLDPDMGRVSMTDGTPYTKLPMPAITPAPLQEEFQGAPLMLNSNYPDLISACLLIKDVNMGLGHSPGGERWAGWS